MWVASVDQLQGGVRLATMRATLGGQAHMRSDLIKIMIMNIVNVAHAMPTADLFHPLSIGVVSILVVKEAEVGVGNKPMAPLAHEMGIHLRLPTLAVCASPKHPAHEFMRDIVRVDRVWASLPECQFRGHCCPIAPRAPDCELETARFGDRAIENLDRCRQPTKKVIGGATRPRQRDHMHPFRRSAAGTPERLPHSPRELLGNYRSCHCQGLEAIQPALLTAPRLRLDMQFVTAAAKWHGQYEQVLMPERLVLARLQYSHQVTTHSTPAHMPARPRRTEQADCQAWQLSRHNSRKREAERHHSCGLARKPTSLTESTTDPPTVLPSYTLVKPADGDLAPSRLQVRRPPACVPVYCESRQDGTEL